MVCTGPHWDAVGHATLRKAGMGQLTTIKHLSAPENPEGETSGQGVHPKGKLLISGSCSWSREVGRRLPVSFPLGWGLTMPATVHQLADTRPSGHQVALQDFPQGPLRVPHFVQAVPSSGMLSLNHSLVEHHSLDTGNPFPPGPFPTLTEPLSPAAHVPVSPQMACRALRNSCSVIS